MSDGGATKTEITHNAPKPQVIDRQGCQDLDVYIEQLYECKQLTEIQIKGLCEKVCY